MIILSQFQGDGEWLEARCGRVTASAVRDVVAVRKRGDGELAGRVKYRAALVAEMLSGKVAEHFVSQDMENGTAMEPVARSAYETRFDTKVRTVGFVRHPEIERAGASPDGLVGEDGGLEIKCPRSSTHVEYFRAGVLPPEYADQVMWCMACTGRAWWDFISYDFDMPERHQIFRVRVQRDEQRIADMENAVRVFLGECDAIIASMNERNPEIAAPAAETQPEDQLGITEDDIAWIERDFAQQAEMR